MSLPIESDINFNEHLSSYVSFVSWLSIAAFVGIVAGTLIDKFINVLSLDCTLLVIIELLLIITIFYVFFKFVKYGKLFFDDWLWGTFSGFMFALTFFASLPSLASNISCSVN